MNKNHKIDETTIQVQLELLDEMGQAVTPSNSNAQNDKQSTDEKPKGIVIKTADLERDDPWESIGYRRD